MNMELIVGVIHGKKHWSLLIPVEGEPGRYRVLAHFINEDSMKIFCENTGIEVRQGYI